MRLITTSKEQGRQYVDLHPRRYRRLRVPKDRDEGRFLTWNRWAVRGLTLLRVLLIGFLGESFFWTRKSLSHATATVISASERGLPIP